jgi:ribosome-associated protein
LATDRRKARAKVGAGKAAGKLPARAAAQASASAPAKAKATPAPGKATPAAAVEPARAEEDLALGQLCAHAAVDRQARDVRLLFVGDRLGIAEYFVLATVHNRRQARAIRDAVREQFKAAGVGLPHSTSEDPDGRWSLYDYGVVVLHVFDDEGRRYFDLDSLWREADEIPIAGVAPGDAAASAGGTSGASGTAGAKGVRGAGGAR